MVEPYYSDEWVSLYLGDCRETTEWLAADVMVTDPPYGRRYRPGNGIEKSSKTLAKTQHHINGIANDDDTGARDTVIAMWGDRPAIVFGDLMLPPPDGTKLTCVYQKPSNAGIYGNVAGIRHDCEAIYLLGPWPAGGIGGRSSVFATQMRAGGEHSIYGRYGHPHAKPMDVMEQLIGLSGGVVADPFAGTGSTLVTAKAMGRRSIGVEIDERYCATAAFRLSQDVLPGAGAWLGERAECDRAALFDAKGGGDMRRRALNLYAGVGGNRALWPADAEVTAVELDPEIAEAYNALWRVFQPTRIDPRHIVRSRMTTKECELTDAEIELATILAKVAGLSLDEAVCLLVDLRALRAGRDCGEGPL